MTDPKKLMIYSSDYYGLGHITRCLKLANEFRLAHTTLETRIITSSPIVTERHMPPGVDFVSLPSITRDAVGNRSPRDPGFTLEQVLEMRPAMVTEAIQEFQPDLMYIDTSVIGYDGEILPGLEWLKQETDTPIVLGMRDVYEAPSENSPGYIAKAQYARERYYDKFVVYGDQSFWDPLAVLDASEAVRSRTQFVGYVTAPIYVSEPEPRIDTGDKKPLVLLTLGGGEDGESVIEAFLEMAAQYSASHDAGYFIIPGPYLPEAPRQRLASKAETAGVGFAPFIQDITTYLAEADLVVSMGGYNTITELFAHGHRALVMPRTKPYSEQLIRAHVLKGHSLLDYIPVGEVSPETLLQKVTALLAGPPQIADARARGVFALDGARGVVRECGPLLFRQ